MKLKSKPHEIEAFKFTGKDVKIPDWFKEAYEKGRAFVTMGEMKGGQPCITVSTKAGQHKAFIGDWVCKNSSGTLFVLSDDEIQSGFEVVT